MIERGTKISLEIVTGNDRQDFGNLLKCVFSDQSKFLKKENYSINCVNFQVTSRK